jgi:hypothetical protein
LYSKTSAAQEEQARRRLPLRVGVIAAPGLLVTGGNDVAQRRNGEAGHNTQELFPSEVFRIPDTDGIGEQSNGQESNSNS